MKASSPTREGGKKLSLHRLRKNPVRLTANFLPKAAHQGKPSRVSKKKPRMSTPPNQTRRRKLVNDRPWRQRAQKAKLPTGRRTKKTLSTKAKGLSKASLSSKMKKKSAFAKVNVDMDVAGLKNLERLLDFQE